MHAPTENRKPSQPLVMRILVRRFAYRHPKAWGGMELVTGAWVLILGVILCSYGFWWGAALIAVAALQLWIGHRLLHSVQS
jgi:hypothetical protein